MSLFATPLHTTKEFKALRASIKVFVRTRPLLEKEVVDGAHNILSIVPEEKLVLVEDGDKGSFTYDGVFDEKASQEYIFKSVVLPLLKHIQEGHNATVIAYGQTGSGKTYTMGTHPTYSVENAGILQRVMKALLEAGREEGAPDKENAAEEEGAGSFLKLSFLEVYNEAIHDLFSARKKLGTEPDGSGGVVPVNCKQETASTTEQGLQLLESGNNLRKVAATIMNAHSSRSHALISVTLHQKKDGVIVQRGCLRMVDLAGAEGVGRNNTGKKGFCEGVSINKGLLAIGKVLAALSSNSSASHVPYRDSIVTRLLRDALGGNSYTAMITCVSPASTNLAVTLNTLRYAEQARNIKNKPACFSTMKRKGMKRILEDISATPNAWKKFISGVDRPEHNSTISTPGHKPPERKMQPLNNTFVTPINRTSDRPRHWPRSSSRTDLTAIDIPAIDLPLQQPVFLDDDSPTHSIVSEATNNTTVMPISPFVERVNSRLEQSILHYEQRMQTQMKDMENRLAEKVATMLIKGTRSRRSKRLEGSRESMGPPSRVKSDLSVKPSSGDPSNGSPFSLADSIAESLMKKETFQAALKGAIKSEELGMEDKYSNMRKKIIPGPERKPLQEMSNANHCSSPNQTVYFGQGGLRPNALPVTSTVACNRKVVRRSTRLSTRGGVPPPLDRKRSCSISPLHLPPITPLTSDPSFISNKTVVCDTDSKSSLDMENTIIFRKDQTNDSSPVLGRTSLFARQKSDQNAAESEESETQFSKGLSPATDHKLSVDTTIPFCTGLNDPLPTDVSIMTAPPPALRRRSTRRSALVATQRNTSIFSGTPSPLRKACQRRQTRRSVSKGSEKLNKSCSLNKTAVTVSLNDSTLGDRWKLVISPTLQRKHSDSILDILNSGSLRDLQKLPTIGPKTAMVIHNFRKMYGKLTKLEDIENIPGLTKSYYSRFMKANLMHQIDFN